MIQKDIKRTFPTHVMFANEDGYGYFIIDFSQTKLRNILNAYAHYNPQVGYCQGMGMLVGIILMQGISEEV